jgi:hypothetical protein
MRVFVVFCAVCLVVALGYWAYNQSILTQQAMRQVTDLDRAINQERARLAVLRAEWAYLNRPDRLRDLAVLNFDDLQLLPITSGNFGVVDMLPYPPQIAGAQDQRDAPPSLAE